MISASTARIQYTVNSLGALYSVPWYFLANGDLAAVVTSLAGVDRTLVLNTDYTAAGAANPSGGSITLTNPAAAVGETLTIYRNGALVQPATYPSGGQFPSATTEQSQDRLTMLIQQLRTEMDRCLRVPISNTALATLAGALARANTVLTFDTNGVPSLASIDGAGTGASNNLVTAQGSTTPASLTNRFSQRYSAMDWGARGDAVTDDSSAINAALSAAALGTSRGTVFLPPGRIYVINSTIAIPYGTVLDISGAQINALGAGANTIFTFADGSTLIGYNAIVQATGTGTALKKTNQAVAGKFDIIGWPYIIPVAARVLNSIGLDVTANYRGVLQVNIADFAKGVFCDGSTVNAYSLRFMCPIITGCSTGMQFAGAKINDLHIQSPYISGGGVGKYGIIRTGASVAGSIFGGYIEAFDTTDAAVRGMVLQDCTSFRVYGTTFDTGATGVASFAIDISGGCDDIDLEVDFAGGWNDSTKTITHTATGRYSLKTSFAGVPIFIWGHSGAPLLTQTKAFTPGIAGTSVAGTPTYTQQTGKATKRGPNVHVEILLAISAKTSISGALNLTGLPYGIKSGTTPAAAFSDMTGLSLPASCTQLIGAGGITSATTIRLQGFGSGVGPNNLTDTQLAASTSIKLVMDYLTDD